MKVDVESVGSFQKRITLTVPPDRVKRELDKAYKQYSRSVRLRGFRPGKAPRKVLEARFGPKIEADIAQDLIQDGWRHVLDDGDLQPVSQPSLTESGNVRSADGFQFIITVDVRPEVELDKYTEVEVVYPTVEITDEEVDAAVASRLEGQAKVEAVEDRPVEAGDMALVELTAKDGDDVVASEPGTMIRTESDPYYPGIESLVIGASVGDEASGEVTFGDDARTETVAGRTLDVTVKVISIQSYQVPELTDELAEELGYEGGVEGMRTALRGRMQQEREELARNQARANLLEKLIEVNRFDVPSGMIDEYLNMLVTTLKEQQGRRLGRDPRTISFGDAQMADLRIRAEFATKSALILEAVARTEELEADEDELEAKIQELADEDGVSVEAVRGRLQAMGQVDQLRDQMLEEKTLDWLLERATFVEPSEADDDAGDPQLKELAKEIVADEVARKADAAPAADDDSGDDDASSDDAGEADLSILSGSIGSLKEALASGDHDAHLDALLAAEEQGKGRKGAIAAIKARQS